MRIFVCSRFCGRRGARYAAAVALSLLGASLGVHRSHAAADAKLQQPTAVIEQLFKNPDAAQALFAPSIDAAGSERLVGVARQLGRNLGAVDGVDYTDWKYRIRFAKALAFVDAGFDLQRRLSSFRITREAPRIQSLDEAKQLVGKLGAKTALLIEKGGKDIAAVDADAPLAIGSAFKLSIMAALADAVDAGKLSRTQIVPLQAKWRALPTGILQDWPDNAPLTLDALAGLMISLSDNTATDAVMDLVGREAIQKYAFGNDPILTPREYLVLSGDDQAAAQQRFLAANATDRAAILKTIATAPLPETGEIGGGTIPSPLEWRYSARQLCTLMERVHALPAMQINAGLAARADWSEIAFKGGSDHGVFNITTRLAKDGAPYCLSVTVNNEHELNETQLVSVLTGLVFFLHDKTP